MESSQGQLPSFGALVISLDFELHWGVRDKKTPDGSYRQNLLGARLAIPRLLDLFEEFEVAATWATVGFLFAECRGQREEFSPRLRPEYADAKLNAYSEPTGESENDDPLHYGLGLIRQIGERARQELATHTFSHYYCLERGETREAFAADLQSAMAIGRHHGIDLRSIVFPRNQFRPGYEDLLRAVGIVCYRGTESNWMYRPRPRGEETLAVRAPRLLDNYISLSGPNLTRWDEVMQPNGLCDVPSSMFLRPYSPQWKNFEPVRLSRLTAGVQAAAEQGKIFHLWWHPHNFGTQTDENLQFLRGALEAFSGCRRKHGMKSLSMLEAANLVRNSAAVMPVVQREAVRVSREQIL
jgi:hypothetical protein